MWNGYLNSNSPTLLYNQNFTSGNKLYLVRRSQSKASRGEVRESMNQKPHSHYWHNVSPDGFFSHGFVNVTKPAKRAFESGKRRVAQPSTNVPSFKYRSPWARREKKEEKKKTHVGPNWSITKLANARACACGSREWSEGMSRAADARMGVGTPRERAGTAFSRVARTARTAYARMRTIRTWKTASAARPWRNGGDARSPLAARTAGFRVKADGREGHAACVARRAREYSWKNCANSPRTQTLRSEKRHSDSLVSGGHFATHGPSEGSTLIRARRLKPWSCSRGATSHASDYGAANGGTLGKFYAERSPLANRRLLRILKSISR